MTSLPAAERPSVLTSLLSRADSRAAAAPVVASPTPDSPADVPAPPSHLAAWAAHLRQRGLTVLPRSHVVPVDLWLARADTVLRFSASGTTVTLRVYPAHGLATMLLRSECDCETHRLAGVGRRTVLAPGILPTQERTWDGARELGWTGVEAGLLRVPEAAAILDRLLTDLD